MAKEKRQGRPPIWESPEQLKKDCDEYFENTPKKEWTITGLALAIGTYRRTLLRYEKKNDEFAEVVKTAKQKVQHSYELALRKRGRSGDIFALKNFGWTDKQEEDKSIVEHVGKIEIVRPNGKTNSKETNKDTSETEGDDL